MGGAHTEVHHHAGPLIYVLLGPAILRGKSDPWSGRRLLVGGQCARFASGGGTTQSITGGQPIRHGISDVIGHYLLDPWSTARTECSDVGAAG